MQSPFIKHHHVLNCYKILGLSPPRHTNVDSISEEELKAAYHRTLLLNHPDKIKTSDVVQKSISGARTSERTYSIDEIVSAYKTLSEPELKRKHDQELLSKSSYDKIFGDELLHRGVHPGVETFDLDDLSFDEAVGRWCKACRCGNALGFVLTETELEEFCSEGEIYIGCGGCSLFIRVLFGLADTGSPCV